MNFKKIQEVLLDSAKLSSTEIMRGIHEAKNQLNKFQMIQKRKDLFAELGRTLYEAHEDGLPMEVKQFVHSTELIEIIRDIKELDTTISEMNSR